MFGCSNFLMYLKLLFKNKHCSSVSSIHLTAYILLLNLFLHFLTTPLLPSPIFSNNQYFSINFPLFQFNLRSYSDFLSSLRAYISCGLIARLSFLLLRFSALTSMVYLVLKTAGIILIQPLIFLMRSVLALIFGFSIIDYNERIWLLSNKMDIFFDEKEMGSIKI